jgi:hypothetical protein
MAVLVKFGDPDDQNMINTNNIYLVGGIPTPLKNMSSSAGMIWKKIKSTKSKPPTRYKWACSEMFRCYNLITFYNHQPDTDENLWSPIALVSQPSDSKYAPPLLRIRWMILSRRTDSVEESGITV